MDISVTTDLMVFFFCFIFRAKSYLWQCILSVGTRNHDKKLHIPKTCSRFIIYNNSLMQWLMSIMRFYICLNVLVHRQYSSCESANFSFDRTMCSSSSCPHAACTQPLFISLSLAFVYLNRVLFRYSWYTKLSLYGDDCIHVKSVNHGLCTFSIYWFSTYVHVALQFLFDTFVSELACCQMLAFIFFYRTISVWIPYTSIISIDTFTNGQVKEKLNARMHGKRRRKTLSSSSSSSVAK